MKTSSGWGSGGSGEGGGDGLGEAGGVVSYSWTLGGEESSLLASF